MKKSDIEKAIAAAEVGPRQATRRAPEATETRRRQSPQEGQARLKYRHGEGKMDPIKEAMIRNEDSGLRVYCRRCGEDLTEIDHDYCIGHRAGHYCYGCEPVGEFMTHVSARTPFDEPSS